MRGVFRKFFADRGTHLAAMIAYFALLSFVPLFFGLLVASFGYGLLRRYVSFVAHHAWVGFTLSVVVSLVAVFVFLVSAYHELTNEEVTIREVLPGAVVATVVLEASFQALP